MAYTRNINTRDFNIITPKKKANFNKIKVGKSILRDDVVSNLDYFDSLSRKKKYDREKIERAIEKNDLETLRLISDYFYRSNGIYQRLCKYLATLFRYDWFITPNRYDNKIKDEKVIEGWLKAAVLLENSRLKKSFSEIALKVIKNGCYYGYKLEQKDAVFLQELPPKYCRSRYKWNGRPAIEFNVKYFDDLTSNNEYRIKILKMFPKEFQKAYIAYKKGALPRDTSNDDIGWFLLDCTKAVKFNLGNSDVPIFFPVIPKLLDLQDMQDLDKKKMEQQILRILIQKFPIDKNGDLIFDTDEVQTLHNNAVGMVGESIGVRVLSTFADVEVADMADRNNVSSVDQLGKVERGVYNEAGVSQLQFNADGNVALEKSIVNDESSVLDLIYQFEEYAEDLLKPFNKNKKRLMYRVQILPTTGYNYKELSKLYKEQTTIGFSKLLPQVALGQTQSSIIATAIFENGMMHLDELFIPPQMSSTMSAKEAPKAGESEKKTGRPELPESEKSDKTIRNEQAEG